MKLISCALLLAGISTALALQNYNNFQVLRTAPLPATLMKALQTLEDDPRFDFWSRPHVGMPMDVMVGPEDVEYLRTVMLRLGLQPTTHIADVGEVVAMERAANDEVKRNEQRSERVVTFDRFMEFDEIMAHIHEVAAANPSIASIVDLATSTEGRGVHALKISSGPGKKAVFMDCAFIGRDWATPPVCLKTIEEVISSSELQSLVDWIILPVANPDGYVFTWTDDRFWRKTRSVNLLSPCIGTNPNRNFDYMWNADSNNLACSGTYPGNAPFSEPEVAGVGDMLRTLGQAGTMALYLSIHSWGQIIYYPYASSSVPAPNAAEMQTAGDIAASAILSVRGTVYEVISENDPAGFVFGEMDDYAYEVGGVPYAYYVELPAGGSGYDPPPSDILPVVTETWEGIDAMVRHVVALSK